MKGLELNNPLNIRRTKERWLGENPEPRSTVWQDFVAPEWCYREADHIIMRHYREGRNLVGDIVGAWAPPTENDTKAYVEGVCARMGQDPLRALKLPQQMEMLLHAMTIQEIGRYPWDTDEPIIKGMALDRPLTPAHEEPSAPPAPRQETAPQVQKEAAPSVPQEEASVTEEPKTEEPKQDPGPLVNPLTPSVSTVASGGFGVALAPVLIWALGLAHIPIPPDVAMYVGVLLSTAAGYIFKGGRAIHTQGV